MTDYKQLAKDAKTLQEIADRLLACASENGEDESEESDEMEEDSPAKPSDGKKAAIAMILKKRLGSGDY